MVVVVVVLAHLGSPGKRAVKRVCVCVCVCWWGVKCIIKSPTTLQHFRIKDTDLSSFLSSRSAAWLSDGLILARNARLLSLTISPFTPEHDSKQ